MNELVFRASGPSTVIAKESTKLLHNKIYQKTDESELGISVMETDALTKQLAEPHL